MSVVCVIPARLNSSRFPEKVLAQWQGKTLLEHVWRQACLVPILNPVFIACDHPKIFETAQRFGAQVRMTSKEHPTGSDRVAEVIQNLECDHVLVLQADEPQIKPDLLEALVRCLITQPQADCATVITDFKGDFGNPNQVKVVIDRFGRALYFSRRLDYGYKHVGIYAYRRSALFRFLETPQGRWEQVESLEQLRLLEAGMVIQTLYASYEGISVDTPEDYERLCLS